MAEEQFNLNSQEFYYHVSPIHLEVGSVIKKGNWGRVLKQYMGNDCTGGLILFRERVLEEIRQKHFPTKPSRLDCIFLLVSIDEAKTYQSLVNLRTSLIYKVRITNPAAAHLGNYNKVQPTPPDYHYEKMDEVATNYWAGIGLNDVTPRVNQATNILEPLTTIELLVQSDIQIVECLN